MRVLLPALLLLPLAACDCGRSTDARAPPPVAPRDRPGEEGSPVAAEPPGGCEVGTVSLLENVQGPPPPVGIAVAGDRGIVAHAAGEGRLRLHAIDAAGVPRGEARDASIPGARALFALQPAGEGFVAVTAGACDGPGADCFHALAVGGDGAPVGAVLSAPRGRLRTVRVRGNERALWLAHADRDGRALLDVLVPTGAGLEHRRTTLRAADEGEGVHVEILALAIEGERWAVLFRVGAAEGPEAEVLLATANGTHEVEALHDALVLETFRWQGEGLVAVAAFEHARPRLFRIDARGEAASSEALPAGRPLPALLWEARSAATAFVDGSLSLVIRDGAGDRLHRLPVVASARPEMPHRGDVARTAEGWLLAFSGPEANGFAVGTARVACR